MTRTIINPNDEEYYSNSWLFNNKPFLSKDIKDYVGFVYLIIELDTQKKYLGRKYFYQLRKVKGKSRRQKTESNWKKYYGSSKEVLEQIKIKKIYNYKRIILSLHTTKGDVNYEEIKQQFQRNVLERDDYYNDNINGKWYKKPEHISEIRVYSKLDKILEI